MLTVAQLQCSRGDRTLFEGVSFTVSPGEVLAVTGRNGSGKTTLLRTLCGLSPYEAGAITWNGQEIGALRERYLSQVLYIGHRNALKDELTPAENLLALGRIRGVDLGKAEIQAAMDAVGLGREIHRLPTRVLSEGQRRRVALARLWCESRPLWILDEPFTALDAQSVSVLRQRFHRHLHEGGLVVTATHDALGMAGEALREIILS